MTEPDVEWAIVELFGHVVTAGRISEVERYGGKMLRLDIPADVDPLPGLETTQLIGHAALYRVTPCTEDIARRVARQYRAEPVHPWSLSPRPALEPAAEPSEEWDSEHPF